MASNVKVIGHFADSSGKVLPQHGTGLQFIVATTLIGNDARLDPADINSKMSSNSKYHGSASQFIVTGYQICDKETNPAGVLS
jgi:hypothetical protein